MLKEIIFLLFFSFLYNCHVDKKIEVSGVTNKRVECKKDKYYIGNLCEDEEAYLDEASNTKQYPRLQDITQEVLRKITVETLDVDKAASLFYHRSITEPSTKLFIESVYTKEKVFLKKIPDYSKQKMLFTVAPGMFYKDNPSVGADGRMLRDVALSLGMMETIIPLEQTGTIETNAGIICNFLKEKHADTQINGIILASVSKGSSDIKKAISICGEENYFQVVRAWYNVGGLNKGSYAINGILDNWRYRVEGQMYFWWHNYNWQGFLDMRGGPDSPVAEELKKPKHLLIINIIGVPLFRHVTQRARPFYEYLIPYGPSDGLTLLADSYMPDTITYPLWRQDHYFPWPIEINRIQAILSYIVEEKFCTLKNPCNDFKDVVKKE